MRTTYAVLSTPPALLKSPTLRDGGEIEQDMGLLQRLKHDLRTGLATLRLGTAQAANRALEETELLRLRLEIRRIDQQLNELFHDVGERAVSLREAGEPA